MGSFFSCAFFARMALLCYRLLGHDQICLQPLNPSVCSSGHNDTAPYPRARANYFNARWASDEIFLSHPDGACGCKCRATPMLHPCHRRGCACPLISTYLHSATFNLITTPLLPCLPLHHAAFCSLRVTCTPAPKPPSLDGVKPPCSMQRQFFRDVPWHITITNVRPL
jgi:hypothetical protein